MRSRYKYLIKSIKTSREFEDFMKSDEVKSYIKEGFDINDIKGYQIGNKNEDTCYFITMKKPLFGFIFQEINSFLKNE